MTPEQVNPIKKHALNIGDRTRGVAMVEITHDGAIHFSHCACLADLVMMREQLTLLISQGMIQLQGPSSDA